MRSKLALPFKSEEHSMPNSIVPVLAIHGGAGTITRAAISPAQEAAFVAALQEILKAGACALAKGQAALDVVQEAVRQLEECPLFNAGRGSVYTADGRHELDACVMEGHTLRAGAVAGVSRIRNPIAAARAVMEHTPHVMLIGQYAEALAQEQGLEIVATDWFGTPQRYAQLQAARKLASGAVLDHDGANQNGQPLDEQNKMGTVGAVALDMCGHLAAATSTGGMTNKMPGRVGDSPIPGAGCYANDWAAVSGTGVGEAFMRTLAGRDVAALMEYGGLSLADAARKVVFERLPQAHAQGSGGLIAVSKTGEVVLLFNTEGMYRGWVRPGHEPECAIYGEPQLRSCKTITSFSRFI